MVFSKYTPLILSLSAVVLAFSPFQAESNDLGLGNKKRIFNRKKPIPKTYLLLNPSNDYRVERHFDISKKLANKKRPLAESEEKLGPLSPEAALASFGSGHGEDLESQFASAYTFGYGKGRRPQTPSVFFRTPDQARGDLADKSTPLITRLKRHFKPVERSHLDVLVLAYNGANCRRTGNEVTGPPEELRLCQAIGTELDKIRDRGLLRAIHEIDERVEDDLVTALKHHKSSRIDWKRDAIIKYNRARDTLNCDEAERYNIKLTHDANPGPLGYLNTEDVYKKEICQKIATLKKDAQNIMGPYPTGEPQIEDVANFFGGKFIRSADGTTPKTTQSKIKELIAKIIGSDEADPKPEQLANPGNSYGFRPDRIGASGTP